MNTLLLGTLLIQSAYAVFLRSPEVHMRAQLDQLKKDSRGDDFLNDWKAPLVGQMEAMEKLLSSKKDSRSAQAAVAASPVLRGVGATLPWAQALLSKKEAKEPKKGAEEDKKALFTKFDINKDKNLSVAEIAKMAPTDKDRFCNAAVAVTCADTDGDESLNEKEFGASLNSSEFTACYLQFEPHCHGHADTGGNPAPRFLNVSKNITNKFRKADTNKDGKLSVDEFAAVAKNMTNTNVTNMHCFSAVSVRCADEDGSSSLDMVEFIDVFSEGSLMNDFQHCMSLNSPACSPLTPSNKSSVPNHTVLYSTELCQDLFAYKFERDICVSLQQKVCGANCTRIVNKGNVTECKELQGMLCKLAKPALVPKPLTHGGNVPNNTLNTTVTVCIAFPTPGAARVWVAREAGGPRPLATKLSYLDCTQVRAFRGMDIGVYVGPRKVASHKCTERDELVMVGVSLKDELGDKAVVAYSFHDEGMRRPILCHAAPTVPAMSVGVYGRTWHAFSNTKNLEGSLAYLQCEVLAQDHDDLLKEHETLEFSNKTTILGHIEVGPLPTLYLVRAGPAHELRSKAHELGHLKY